MKVVLTALNSQFIHSNLAVRYLKAYTRELDCDCIIKEFSINDRKEKVLEELIREKPDILAFSCYIWNIEFIQSIVKLVKLVNPEIEILYGGPEVSYDSKSFLEENPGEYLIFGEGEESFYQFLSWRLDYEKLKIENILQGEYLEKKNQLLDRLNKVSGLCFRKDGEVVINSPRELVDMNKLVFPYDEEDSLENKIVYYEASRGCPFSCKYCISSTIHGVRFLDLERVKKELKFLIDKRVRLLKFVDRTFNCSSKFAKGIWQYLMTLDTETTFHFEISADVLDDEQLELLARAPKGRFQFEVGVQTTNNQVLKNINRFVDFNDIKKQVLRLNEYGNIMQHLDLIAGLPGENLESFKQSFNDLYNIQPGEIQLGFLKVLKGSPMEEEAEQWGIVYSPYSPYEVLKTKDISYEELLILKKVEEVVDKYYNSGKFKNILRYFLPQFKTPFDFYYELGMFFYNKGYLNRNISSADYYKVFIEFNEEKLKKDSKLLKEVIKYDYLKFNKKKWLPEFLKRERIKEEERKIKDMIDKKEILVSDKFHIEKFFADIESYLLSSELKAKELYVVFDEKENKEIFVHDVV